MSNFQNSSPFKKNYQQKSLLSFLSKPQNTQQQVNRHNDIVMVQDSMNSTQSFNPRNLGDQSRLFNNIKDYQYEDKEDNKEQQVKTTQGSYQIVKKQSAQQYLDLYSGSQLPSNVSLMNTLISQQQQQQQQSQQSQQSQNNKRNNSQQQYFTQQIDQYERDHNTDEDDVIDIIDKNPFNRRPINDNMQRQGSVEDIDDSIEIVDEDFQYSSNQQLRQKGVKPLTQIITNPQKNNSSNNILTSLQHQQIFRPKLNFLEENQHGSQDTFNFNSNSQQKGSQEIIQELEMQKMKERQMQERLNRQRNGFLQNQDDIKLVSNRFQVDPASHNKQRQLRLEEIDSYKYQKQPQSTYSSDKPQTQAVQLSSILSNLNKNNIFVNPQSQKDASTTNRNKEILEKFSKNSKKPAISDNFSKGRGQNRNDEDIEDIDISDEEDDDEEQSNEDDSNDHQEKSKKKKQKLNNSSSGKTQLTSMQAYHSILSQKTKNFYKAQQKEEEKLKRARQQLIEKARQEREKKQEEESKLQRQKLASYKNEQIQKERQRLYELSQKAKLREIKKQTNFLEEYKKTASLKAKQFLLSSIGQDKTNGESTNSAADQTAEKKDQNGMEIENNKQVIDLIAYDKEYDFLFDETENEAERKNFYSLIKFIFSQDFNKEDIIRVDNKRIPNKSPFNVYAKLTSLKENQHGFFELQIFRTNPALQDAKELENGELNSTEDDFYRLCTLKNHAVLISNESDPDFANLSSTDFKKKKTFLFFGWVVPPEGNSKDTLKIYVDINAQAFIKQFMGYDGSLPIKIFTFQKMTTFIREYLSIKNMRYNDLNRFIYNPQHIVETRTPISNPQTLIQLFEELKSKYNASQFQSIKEICLTSQGICMLQGPPGTGKTHTLLGLLSGLYHYIKKNPDHTKPKIMICAPSNTAVDEIVSRIIEYGLHGPGGQKVNINVLRIGAIDYVPTENVKKACLEYQIERNLKEKGMNEKNKKIDGDTLMDMQIDVAKINQEIEKSKKELFGQELTSELDYLFQKKRKLQSKISVLKLEKVARRDQIKNISDQLLGLADVVCCTLASSISEKLERFKNQVEVLIVDEAAQKGFYINQCIIKKCTEPNNIIPLFYQPNKMVLIGDPKQLPATTFQPDSNITKYNRSLFERIIDNNIKPYFLDQQYRMHPNIREFPSFQFYDNKLKDGGLVANRPFPGYLQKLEKCNVQFIDIVFSKERMNHKSYENESESLASISICNAIIDEIEKFKKNQPDCKENPSIGIITPYKQQTKLMSELIRKNIPKAYHKIIQVNTVDSFQGQEKDIIIFTTVRVNNRDEWRENMIGFLQDERRMNVALTRARYCLIVLGHADTLNSNPIWGAFVDFMAKNKRYGKFRNRDQLSDIGKMVLKGSLLEGSSADYVKKDWGDQYREMLLRANQVNELKLTDFEPIQIEDNSNEETNQINAIEGSGEKNKQEADAVLQSEEIQQDQPIVKGLNNDLVILSEKLIVDKKDSKPPLEIIEEPDDFDQQRVKRTGISLTEAIKNQQEQMLINNMRGSGLGGLSALIGGAKDKKKEERKPEMILLNKDEDLKKEEEQQQPHNELIQKIFVDKKKKQEVDQNKGEEDIYAAIERQKRENLMKLKKEKSSFKESQHYNKSFNQQKTSSITQAAMDAVNQIKQKLQNNSNDSASNKLNSASNQKSSIQPFQQFTSPSLPSTQKPARGLGNLIGGGGLDQDTSSPPQKPQKDNPLISNINSSVDIYDQLRMQRREHIQKKQDDTFSNSKNQQNKYMPSSSSSNSSSIHKSYNSYNTSQSNRPYSPSHSEQRSQQLIYSKNNFNEYDQKQSTSSKYESGSNSSKKLNYSGGSANILNNITNPKPSSTSSSSSSSNNKGGLGSLIQKK